MSILKLLKDALNWTDPYEDMPDYGHILEHLGLDESATDEDIREAIEMEIADMDPDGDGEAEADGDE